MAKLNRKDISSVPEQICVGAVQRPLLADMRPSNAGPSLMSACSLCGAEPAVQLHHEHVVTNISNRGWLQVKDFIQED